MGRACSICWHESRDEIERRLCAYYPLARLAREHGLAASSLRRHRKNHMPALFGEPERRGDGPGEHGLEAGQLYRQTLELLRRAEASGDARGSIVALREARQGLLLLARLRHSVDQATPDAGGSGELQGLIRAVTDALKPFPEAGRAVALSLLQSDSVQP